MHSSFELGAPSREPVTKEPESSFISVDRLNESVDQFADDFAEDSADHFVEVFAQVETRLLGGHEVGMSKLYRSQETGQTAILRHTISKSTRFF